MTTPGSATTPADARELQAAIEGRQPSVILPDGHGLTFTATLATPDRPAGVAVSVGAIVLFERTEPFTVVIGSAPATGKVEARAAAHVATVDELRHKVAGLTGRNAHLTHELFEAARRAHEAEARAAAVDEEKATIAARLETAQAELAKMAEYAHLLATGLSDSEARGTVWPEPEPAPGPT